MSRQPVEHAEKRSSVRYPFSPAVEAVELQSHNHISARLSDIAKNGCYVDTINPFAAKSKVQLTITKDKQTFKTHAEVVYSQMGMGMGLLFTDPEPGHVNLLSKWLAELSGEPQAESNAGEPGSTNAAPETSPYEQSAEHELRGVLTELVTSLRRKKVLNDGEGRAMLQKLCK